ncbi:MAG TPA: hypothetical protein PLH50_04860, partial [Ottowia beijingensis]|nr:hypothetical protein [Ottowia beijingensis]
DGDAHAQHAALLDLVEEGALGRCIARAAASPTATPAPCGPRLINSRLICNQASARRGFFVIFTRSEGPRMNAAGV